MASVSVVMGRVSTCVTCGCPVSPLGAWVPSPHRGWLYRALTLALSCHSHFPGSGSRGFWLVGEAWGGAKAGSCWRGLMG